MKKILFIFSLFIASFQLEADPIKKDPVVLINSQLSMLDDLIIMTKKSLKSEEEIKELIVDYLKIQKAYLSNQSDKEITLQMVLKAHQILVKMNDSHLTHQFDPDFVSELALFSKIATKKGIPKP